MRRLAYGWVRSSYAAVSGSVVTLDDSLVVRTARDELLRGVASMLDRRLPAASGRAADAGIVLGTRARVMQALPRAAVPELTSPDAFWLGMVNVGRRRVIVVAVNRPIISPLGRRIVSGIGRRMVSDVTHRLSLNLYR